MGKMLQDRRSKMVRINLEKQGDFPPKEHDTAIGRQTLCFRAIKINNKTDRGAVECLGAEQPNMTRLNHAADGLGAAGRHAVVLPRQDGAIIGDEAGSKCHQTQGQRGFTAPGCAENEHRTALMGDTGGMSCFRKRLRRRFRHR